MTLKPRQIKISAGTGTDVRPERDLVGLPEAAERPAAVQRSRFDRDPTRPVYVISVVARIVAVHPRTLRIYEDEGLNWPARTPINIRLYSDHDLRRIL